jgi:hypothetical protein
MRGMGEIFASCICVFVGMYVVYVCMYDIGQLGTWVCERLQRHVYMYVCMCVCTDVVIRKIMGYARNTSGMYVCMYVCWGIFAFDVGKSFVCMYVCMYGHICI